MRTAPNVILPYSVVSGHFWQKPASVQGPPEFVEAGEEREKLKIENPTFIATEEMLWLRADGTEILIQAAVGIPYKDRGAWACPVALTGVDDRYPDIVGESAIQSLNLAMNLIRQRLGHLLDAGEVLTYRHDRNGRWDRDTLNAIFGPP